MKPPQFIALYLPRVFLECNASGLVLAKKLIKASFETYSYYSYYNEVFTKNYINCLITSCNNNIWINNKQHNINIINININIMNSYSNILKFLKLHRLQAQYISFVLSETNCIILNLHKPLVTSQFPPRFVQDSSGERYYFLLFMMQNDLSLHRVLFE